MASLPRLLPVLFLSAAALAARDSALHGKVFDSSRAAVSQAWVTLHRLPDGEERRTRTTPQGEYLFAALTPGEYLVEADAPGMAATPVTVTIRDSETKALEIVLEVDRLPQRVTVTSASAPLSVDETAKALDTLPLEDIERRQEYAVSDVLRQVPGMRVQQLGGPGSLVRIHTRGLRAFDTAVLIDGFRMRDTSAPQGDAQAFLGDLLAVNPSRVEVLRGSGSSLYGTHAVGGVIHVITDQGGGPFHGEVSMDGGGLGMFGGVARGGGSALGDRLQYSAGVAHRNVTSGIDSFDPARNTSTQSYARYQLASRTHVSARLFTTEAANALNLSPFAGPAANLPARGYATAAVIAPDVIAAADAGRAVVFGTANVAPSINDPDARRLARTLNGMAALTHSFTPSTTLRLAYQGLGTRRDNRDGPGGIRFQPRFNKSDLYEGRTDNVQARVDGRWGAQLLTGGYEFENESFDAISRDQNPDPAARVFSFTGIRQRSNSVFAQDQVRLINNRLLVSLSGRWQGFALRSPRFEGGAPRYQGADLANPPNAWTGDAAVAYFFRSAGTKLRAHAGNAYRAPALYERFGTSFFGGAFYPLGDPRLRPDRSVAFDGGIDQYFGASRVRVSATYFYTRLQQVVAFGSLIGRDPFDRFSGYLNTRGGLARGAELSGEASVWRGGRLQASYTHTRSQERTSLFVDGLLDSVRIPRHMVTLMLLQRVGKRLDFSFDFNGNGRAVTPLFVDNVGTRAFLFPGMRKADVTMSYRLPVTERVSTEFFTRIENVLNRTSYEDGFRLPRAWAVGGIRLRF